MTIHLQDDAADTSDEPSSLDSLAERFEAEDDAADSGNEDALEEGAEDAEGEDPDDEHTEEEAEHADEDTESSRDGDDEETSDDSAEADDKDADDGDPDDQNTESGDDADAAGADDEEGGEEDEADPLSPEAKAALERNGADLKLEDVPKEYRGIVEKKLQAADVAFTRTMQQLSTFRAEQTKFRADQAYQDKNPDLVIVELLRKGGADLMDKVNKRIAKLDPEAEGNDATSVADYGAALDAQITDQRGKAKSAVEAEFTQYEARVQRAEAIETYARTAATKARVPLGKSLERSLANAIARKPADQQDLSEAEIDEIVTEYATEFHANERRANRDASKRSVVDRTQRRAAKPTHVRPPKGTASPVTTGKKKIVVNHDDEDSRQAAMMRTARRVMPGVKD